MRVLTPIDGSPESLHALELLLDRAGWYATPLEIHLLNVQRPLPQDVSRFIDAEALREFHHDAGMACLVPARDKAAARGNPCTCHVVVGEAGEAIVHFARQLDCQQIALGARGLGALPGLVLGSVTTRVLHLADRPVLVLK